MNVSDAVRKDFHVLQHKDLITGWRRVCVTEPEKMGIRSQKDRQTECQFERSKAKGTVQTLFIEWCRYYRL